MASIIDPSLTPTMAPPAFHMFDPNIFILEVLFCAIALIFCLLIYFKTKEIYTITKSPSIKYFRGAFLFFGVSYLLSGFMSIVFFSSSVLDYNVQREFMLPFLLITGYVSTMAILYLLFSIMWKKLSSKYIVIYANLFAIALSLFTFAFHSHFVILIIQALLLILAIVFVIISKKIETKHIAVKDASKKITSKETSKATSQKAFSQMKMLYIFVALLWLLNLFTLGRRGAHDFEIGVALRVISLCVFVYVYYRVSKWLL